MSKKCKPLSFVPYSAFLLFFTLFKINNLNASDEPYHELDRLRTALNIIMNQHEEGRHDFLNNLIYARRMQENRDNTPTAYTSVRQPSLHIEIPPYSPESTDNRQTPSPELTANPQTPSPEPAPAPTTNNNQRPLDKRNLRRTNKA